MAEAASGGRTWWAHFEFIRINIEPIIFRKKIEEQLVVGAFHVVERDAVPIRAGGTRSLLAKSRNRIQACGTLRGKPHGNERHDRKQQCDRREDGWIAWSHTE
jgi:hypothetical protein